MSNQDRERLWVVVWSHCAALGMVDGLGGAEYRRLKSLWIIDGRPWRCIGAYVCPEGKPPSMRTNQCPQEP